MHHGRPGAVAAHTPTGNAAAGGSTSSMLSDAAKQQLTNFAVKGAVKFGGMLLGGALGAGAAAGSGTGLFGN